MQLLRVRQSQLRRRVRLAVERTPYERQRTEIAAAAAYSH